MRARCALWIWTLGGLLACSRTGIPVPDAGLAGQDPADAVPCIELPVDGRGAVVDLSTDARLRRADVFFLLDTSGSMQQEIGEIRRTLRNELAPLIGQTFPDVEFGVGMFSDFPVLDYGAPGDVPFELGLEMTADLGAIQAALDRVGESSGLDTPESQVEALYQVATGEGLGRYVRPSVGCPSGGFGAPCFRTDAEPVVLLFTDAPFHNGPRDLLGDRYIPGVIRPEPHLYGDALEVLQEHRIRVIGLWSGEADGSDQEDLALVAQDTGALNGRGDPLVFDIGEDGERLGAGVVSSLSDFAEAAIFDVGVVALDPEPLDGVDVTAFLAEVRPVATIPDVGAVLDPEAARILGVRAGTTVVFEVVLRADAVVPGESPQRFRVRLQFRGDEEIFLGEREVDVVVPSVTGQGCEVPAEPLERGNQ
ncbi:MAG: VWA domain-containing protein [Myxococcales bacterium]|nr:VWA domain-containing protein [Myxococcales bacterium]MDD9970363.1 VWA domain-containing protein [Myxococcales bacterium]